MLTGKRGARLSHAIAMARDPITAMFALLGRVLNRWLHPVPERPRCPLALSPQLATTVEAPVLVRAGPASGPVQIAGP